MTTKTKETIGFIGLGIMGKPMSKNLINSDYPLVVHDIVRESMDELIGLGAKEALSPMELASAVDVVITMLPDTPDVELVYLGDKGVLKGVRPDTVLVDMSTISPIVSVKLAEAAKKANCPMLDAPVSGGDVGAQKRTLSIMVGGDPEVFDKTQHILDEMGKSILCGKNGAGQTVKACNQILVAVTLVGMSEALVLGAKAGVDPGIIVQVLSGGLARCGVLENRGMRAIARDFSPGFKSRLHYKDLNIIREAGRAYSCCLPASALAHELFGAMQTQGWGELDHSAVLRLIETLSDVEVKAKNVT